MVNGRVKGHCFERALAKTFRERGWPDCLTARLESKRVDDSGVDLCFTKPFNVQAKAVENLGSAHNTLARMPADQNLNVVFHKKRRQGVVVSLTEADFWTLVKLAGYGGDDD
jgi:hypothetical protein